jgi:hypothetical protein
MEARDHLEDLGVDERIMLEYVQHEGVKQIHLLIFVMSSSGVAPYALVSVSEERTPSIFRVGE